MPVFTFDPLSNPGAADVFVAAGVQSPGVAILHEGGDREYNWDIRQAPGVQGYTLTYRGWKAGDPIVFRILFYEHKDGSGYASRQSQVESFYRDFAPIFSIDARKVFQKIQPISIVHPILNANDINAVVPKKIGRLQSDGRMLWWIDLTLLEYRPPKIVPAATPKGATDRLGQPTPETKIQEEIAKEKILADRPL